MAGYFKTFRSITSWEWYDDPYILKLWIHLLATVEWCKKEYQGLIIYPGQRLVGINELANECKFSYQRTRTIIDKLKSTNEITCKATNGKTLITVVNYGKYQNKKFVSNEPSNIVSNEPSNEQATRFNTSEQRASNEQATNLPLYKKNKNIKNIKNTRNKEGTALEIALENNYGYMKYCLFADEKGEPRLDLVDYVLMRDGVAE